MKAIFSNFSGRSRLIGQLHKQQAESKSQDEWMDLAERIDSVQGHDVWRSDPKCALYEQDRISHRIDEYVHLMRRNDIFELMFTLRGGIHRNKFGLLHEGLFSKAMAGSKVLVETYHNVVCAALDFVCDAPVPQGEAPIPTEARLAFFNETRHSYGRTALLFSGGAALGIYHVGVAKCLMENGLMPRVLSGASAGSILCAMLGTRTDEECTNDLFQAKGTEAPGHSGDVRFNFFSPVKGAPDKHDDQVLHNSAGGFRDAKRTLQLLFPIGVRRATSTMYDILTGNRRPQDMLNHDTEHLRECLRINIGDFTFQEAFDRTGRIINIIVTPNNSSDPPRLLNYLTAPHVLVWSAAVASSSLPGVFEANKLMVKDADGTERSESAEPTHFSDGSMEADLPMDQLSEMFNVNHFIISQANPHAVMFASFGLSKTVWTNPILGMMTQVLMLLKNQTRAWFKHCVELVGGSRIAPLFDTRRGLWSSFFTQEYEGRPTDISLIPWISHRGFFSALAHCLYNPNMSEYVAWAKAAERETWKYIPAIKSHIAEEVTLDRCVQRLRKRMLLESWEKCRQGLSSAKKLGGVDRVPSFFTSPSLVNLGGEAVADVPNLPMAEDSAQIAYDEMRRKIDDDADDNNGLIPVNGSQLQNGWGGMGLRGNQSTGSLNRSISPGVSDTFLVDSEDQGQQQQGTEQQVAGENTVSPQVKKANANGSFPELGDRYVKTSSMAHFYYRKSGGSVENFLMRHSKSHNQIAKDVTINSHVSTSDNGGDEATAQAERRRSKSAVDLGKAELS
jgi:TAG lipase/steryl ester hydrolase/phospholipase A2/LPA acyltransferase